MRKIYRSNDFKQRVTRFSQIIFIGFSLMLGTGCATARQVTGPNGEQLYAIDCSGPYAKVADCIEKAGQICGGKGYEVMGGYGASLGNAASVNQWGAFSLPQVNREMVIRCRQGGENKGS